MCRCSGHWCGFNTKKSVVFSAFYSVFTAVVCMSMMLLRFTTKVDLEIQADISALSYGSLAIYSIHLVVSFVLLAGANLDRRGTFFPWVAWTFVVMMYEALAVLLYFTTSKHKQKGLRRWDLFSSFFYIIRTSVNIYCLICVICRYRIIRASAEAPCTYIFPSAEDCGRRPRLQKDLITVVESAFRPSTHNLAPNTVILLTSLPPPYDTTEPPPYGDQELQRAAGRGGCSRVVVECGVEQEECTCKQHSMVDTGTEQGALQDELTFLRERHSRHCRVWQQANNGELGTTTTTTTTSRETRLRHGTIVWDEDSDTESNSVSDTRGQSATIYRNPMVTGTSCAPPDDV